MQIPVKFSSNILLLWFGLFRLVATASWYTATDGHEYLIEESQSYNWLQALDQCSRRGLQLAVIDSSSKNIALVALLRSIYGKSIDLWLGHHDEFNTKKDKTRSWYSASTGQPIPFTYWGSGQPNSKAGEHCVEIYRKADFHWNDENCDKNSFGYICEEHHQTVQCRLNIEAIRQEAYQKNSQLSDEFLNIQNTIKELNENTRLDTDNLLERWQKSFDDAVDNFKKSLNEVLRKKPYLHVVLADVGATIKGLALDTKDEITTITEETRQSIEDVHWKSENSTNAANSEFYEKLTKNKDEIDMLMVYTLNET